MKITEKDWKDLFLLREDALKEKIDHKDFTKKLIEKFGMEKTGIMLQLFSEYQNGLLKKPCKHFK